MTPTDQLALLTGADDRALFADADAARRRAFGDSPRLQAVIDLSNVCDRQCRYCSLRAENRRLERYRLRADRVLDAAGRAAAEGVDTVILRSGTDPGCAMALVGELIREIKARHGLTVFLALGDRRLDEFAFWRECGADGCHLSLETTDPDRHKRLRMGETLGDRLHRLEGLRDLGYAVGSGVVAGLPGATPLDGLRDLLFLADLDLDRIEAGPFVPRADTPLAAAPPGSIILSQRMTALLRLLAPKADIAAGASLDGLRPGARDQALSRGCNVVARRVAPAERGPSSGDAPSDAGTRNKRSRHVG